MTEQTKTGTKPTITRDQLRFMRDLTMEFAKCKSANQNWKKHLVDLSNQCDILDAVMSRANIKAMEIDGKKINRVIETSKNINEAEQN